MTWLPSGEKASPLTQPSTGVSVSMSHGCPPSTFQRITRLIVAGRDDLLAIRREGRGLDIANVPTEGTQERSRVRPKAGGLIAAGGQERLAVARPDDAGHFIVMAAEIAAKLTCGRLPDLHDAIADGQRKGEGRAVGADRHRVDAVAKGPRAEQAAAVGIPHKERAIVHAGKDQPSVRGEGQGERPRIVKPPQYTTVGCVANHDFARVIAADQPPPVAADGQRDDRRGMIGNGLDVARLADVRTDKQIAAVGGGPGAVVGDDEPARAAGELVFDDQAGASRRHAVRSSGTTDSLLPIAASHTIICPSSASETICPPSGVTTTCRTMSECPRSVLLPLLWAAPQVIPGEAAILLPRRVAAVRLEQLQYLVRVAAVPCLFGQSDLRDVKALLVLGLLGLAPAAAIAGWPPAGGVTLLCRLIGSRIFLCHSLVLRDLIVGRLQSAGTLLGQALRVLIVLLVRGQPGFVVLLDRRHEVLVRGEIGHQGDDNNDRRDQGRR